MSDPFSNQQPGQFPAPGQPSCSPPPPPGPTPSVPQPSAQPPYGAPMEPVYTGYPAAGAVPPGFSPPGSGEPLVGSEPPPRRSRGKMIGALVGVVALIAAGAFAFTQLRSNDDDGGAASPEEVGTDLVAALDNEDILGAIDLLLPGERETFRQPLIDFVSELTRLQVTDDSADLGGISGLDITIAEPEIEVSETNVDDISHVNIVSQASLSVDGAELPFGDFLIETVFGGERPDVEEDSGDQDFDITFATVEEDGRWYISLFYSAAEAIRGDRDIPDEGITAVGADSPEGALDNLIQYTVNLDLENIIASLNPNEASALQRYGPLFVDDAQNSLDEVAIAWSITDTEFSVDGSGDRRQVGLSRFHFEAQVEGETIEFDWEDGCLIGTTPQGEFDSCTALNQEAGGIDGFLEQYGLDGSEPLAQTVEDFGEAFSDFSLHGIVVDQVDGKWFVSPIGTGAETFLSVLRALDRDEIETIVNDISNVVSDIFGQFDMGDIDMPDIDLPTDDTIPDVTIPDVTIPDVTIPDVTIPDVTIPDVTIPDVTIPDVTIPDVTIPDVSIPDVTIPEGTVTSHYECLYTFTDEESIAKCIEDGVASGNIDTDFVPGPLLYPACGLFGYYAGTEIYTDDAATFLATIEPGRQCVVDAAAADGVDLLFSSPEIVHPECFVADNPYNFDEPDEVSGYECAFSAG